jgi:hypothetical protein
LAAVRLGARRVRVRKADLKQFIAESTKSAETSMPSGAGERRQLADELSRVRRLLWKGDDVELLQSLDTLIGIANAVAAAIQSTDAESDASPPTTS